MAAFLLLGGRRRRQVSVRSFLRPRPLAARCGRRRRILPLDNLADDGGDLDGGGIHLKNSAQLLALVSGILAAGWPELHRLFHPGWIDAGRA